MQPSIDVFGISIKTFGLACGTSFVLCGLVLARRLRELGKPVDWSYEIIFAGLVGGIVGARLWYVADHTGDLGDDFFGTLFGGSGLVWYGGALGGAIGVVLWASRH